MTWCLLADVIANGVYFDLQNGVIGTTLGTATATMTAVGDGWYRLTVTFTSTGSVSGGINFHVTTGNGVLSYAGANTTDGAYFWGAQVEARSSVTAYTATTTQAITNYNRQLKTAAANEWPREFDPVTGECLGRSVWEARTNLVAYSEQFDNGYWLKNNVTVKANQILSPDGTLSADKVVDDTNTGQHRVRSNYGTPSTTNYSVFAKAGEYTKVAIFNASLSTVTIFDLQNGTVVSTGTGFTDAKIQSVGNGWYRISATSALINLFGYGLINDSDEISFAGTGTSGAYFWGAQYEAGSFATPYIPTVAAQVTRVADSATITGTNFSSWFNPSEGALFVKYQRSSLATVSSYARVFEVSDGTTNNRARVTLGDSSSNINYISTVNAATQCDLSLSSQIAGSDVAIAVTYKFNDYSAVKNGGTAVTDTTALVAGTMSQLNIGQATGGGTNMTKWLS